MMLLTMGMPLTMGTPLATGTHLTMSTTLATGTPLPASLGVRPLQMLLCLFSWQELSMNFSDHLDTASPDSTSFL